MYVEPFSTSFLPLLPLPLRDALGPLAADAPVIRVVEAAWL